MSFQDVASRMRKHADHKAAASSDTPPTNFEELYRLRARILGVLIRDAREAAELSIEACAAQIGVPADTLAEWEFGKAMPNLPQLELLAYTLNLPISHFWGTDTTLRTDRELHNPQEYVLIRTRIIGGMLRAAREQQNLSPEDLAAQAGVSPGHINAYELGQRPIPTPVLVSLAAACKVNLNYFLENGNRVGSYLLLQEDVRQFNALPADVRHFVAAPINQPYIELAMKLARLGTDELRAIAEAILDITL